MNSILIWTGIYTVISLLFVFIAFIFSAAKINSYLSRLEEEEVNEAKQE